MVVNVVVQLMIRKGVLVYLPAVSKKNSITSENLVTKLDNVKQKVVVHIKVLAINMIRTKPQELLRSKTRKLSATTFMKKDIS